MTTLLAFVGAIALLVVFHELGHYLVARLCDVKVLRFSIGFGKVIYRKRFADSETEWAISAIPLGGYVKMLDEREGAVSPGELHRTFNRKPVLQRMAIVVSGPLANFLLAIVLYWALFVHGVPGVKPVLGEVPQGTPAASAQMQAGETITHINGEAVPSWQDARWLLLDLALQQSEVQIEGRGAQGERLSHVLDMHGLEAKDLDGEFLDKLGLHLYQPVIPPVIGQVAEDSVAQRAGLRQGDEIFRANGAAVQRWNDVVAVVRAHPEQAVQFDIRRGEATLSVALVPQAVEEGGKRIGKIGAAPQVDKAAWKAMLTEVSYGPLDAAGQALRKTWETSVISLKMLGKMVLGEVSMKNLSGPITIADYAGQSAGMGIVAYLGFLALISISLGVLNLLPIPLLDGGHLLYYVAELVKGSPVSEQAWEIGQRIGIALLGTLMVFAIYNDINRLISG
ncbi:zinc metalloprotease [Ferrigenium kumadai]|uniref:Zinc metalloprotease n=1 Tax=Ferrigenium kumadai TaxID=1682490 RepID=A0AAN1T188_9PROT|nr:RIP metalloprotease RseP [Ferrigenium kumadai]BBI99504.1 zinc metalloprotease [Ferrigenium kumadai]